MMNFLIGHLNKSISIVRINFVSVGLRVKQSIAILRNLAAIYKHQYKLFGGIRWPVFS